MDKNMNVTEIVDLDLYAEELPERLNAMGTEVYAETELAASTLGTAACYGTLGSATGTFGTFGCASSVSSLT